MRMSYRPSNMQVHRFVTEIWSNGASKLQLVSSSWKSMMHQERLDASYSAFVAELHWRIGRSNAPTQFEQGSNRLIFFLNVVMFSAVELALMGLTARALQADAIGGATIIILFLGVFTWQGGNFLRRNRPRVYRPGALPAMLMPKA